MRKKCELYAQQKGICDTLYVLRAKMKQQAQKIVSGRKVGTQS